MMLISSPSFKGVSRFLRKRMSSSFTYTFTKAAHLALFIHEPFLDAGEARLQFDDRLADGGGVDFDQLLVVGQLAERRWDSDFFWHKLPFLILAASLSR
jgi:hypothetical protein